MIAFGAHEELQLLALLVAAAALLLLADPLRIPYPILLVLGGLLLGFTPGRPRARRCRRTSSWSGSCRRSSTRRRSTRGCASCGGTCGRSRCSRSGSSSLTTVAVAAVAHYVIGLSWPAGFVLGAVVSPTDPLAATAIARRSACRGAPSRSSRARASSTTAPRSCSSSSPSRRSSPARSRCSRRARASSGRRRRHRRRARGRPRDPPRPPPVDNPPLEVTIAFLTGYFAFLPASAIGASGVLAVVTAGVYMGWHTPELTTVRHAAAGRRVLGDLQLPPERAALRARRPPAASRSSSSSTAAPGRSSSATRRCVWVVVVLRPDRLGPPIAYIPRWLSPSLRERDPAPPWQFIAVHRVGRDARSGVTLAAALAIPLSTDSGAPFPDRVLIIFLAFCVVLATLVVQGLSLPRVVRAPRARGGQPTRRARRRRRASRRPRPRWPGSRSWWTRTGCDADTAERVRGLYDFRTQPLPGALRRRRRRSDRRAVASPTSGCDASCSRPSGRGRRPCATRADQRGRDAARSSATSTSRSRV